MVKTTKKYLSDYWSLVNLLKSNILEGKDYPDLEIQSKRAFPESAEDYNLLWDYCDQTYYVSLFSVTNKETRAILDAFVAKYSKQVTN